VWVFVVVDLALIPVLVVVGIKMLAASGATLRDSLSTRDGAVSQPEEWAGVTGKEGIALTHLRPSGSAMIDNKKYDVVSSGAFIEKGRQITVVAVDGNRIVVHEKP
jgi:membrane-bound serine protease (ClpP class)